MRRTHHGQVFVTEAAQWLSRAGILAIEKGDSDPAAWGLDLPKGCPCTPKLVCQARPHLFGSLHDCSTPDFPVQQAYSMNGSSGRLPMTRAPWSQPISVLTALQGGTAMRFLSYMSSVYPESTMLVVQEQMHW